MGGIYAITAIKNLSYAIVPEPSSSPKAPVLSQITECTGFALFNDKPFSTAEEIFATAAMGSEMKPGMRHLVSVTVPPFAPCSNHTA
jgi:hypothetical protein